MEWRPDREGFITVWMTAGPRAVPYSNDVRIKNQLVYETYLRSVIAEHPSVDTSLAVKLGQKGRLGQPWQFAFGSGFINLSTFYSTMHRVSFDAVTVLCSEIEQEVSAVLWSYAAADLYVNGVRTAVIDHPVYKPISRTETVLHLNKGRNQIYIACENLGVRDTRSVVGLQLKGSPKLTVSLADPDAEEQLKTESAFLEGTRLERSRLVFPFAAPCGTAFTWRSGDLDFEDTKIPVEWTDISEATELILPSGKPFVRVRTGNGQAVCERAFERTEEIVPNKGDASLSYEENLKVVFARVAAVGSENRGDGFGFPIANMLARKALSDTSRDDDQYLSDMLDLIEERVDCADFLICGLIRYLHNYSVSDAQMERVRHALLNFRYWMDMDGFDGMCFWSENHCLMFYESAMHAGELFPDDFFPLAKMTGRELHAWGRGKVLEWLDDVETYGYEEFLSAVYMCVTFAAILNVIDYSEEAISRRAAALCDEMFRELALHTWKDGFMAPMGRVYRGVIYPFANGAMALMNMVNPKLPWDFGEGWTAFYATSRYQIPDGLVELMEKDCDLSWTTGNARIHLEKNADYCLTSVESPRENYQRWENETLKDDVDPSTHAFTRSFNERFHGTTCFEPGTSGYQQHMWYAALSGEAAIFVNHPGSDSEGGDMRPGYWHGNGVMPALRQTKGTLGMIYEIPKEQPFHFIHLYCPQCRFDRMIKEPHWIFMQKDQGYLAFWSSVETEGFDGMNSGCEERMYGSHLGCMVYAGGREYASLEDFAENCKAKTPVFNEKTRTLTGGDFSLTWIEGHDRTQVY